jgi:DNA modification methylase
MGAARPHRWRLGGRLELAQGPARPARITETPVGQDAVTFEIRQGDALALLRAMPDASVQACVTSPPYWGLRDYGTAGQLGLEETPELYVERLVEVFREVRRVLRKDGTLWLNLGGQLLRPAPERAA